MNNLNILLSRNCITITSKRPRVCLSLCIFINCYGIPFLLQAGFQFSWASHLIFLNCRFFRSVFLPTFLPVLCIHCYAFSLSRFPVGVLVISHFIHYIFLLFRLACPLHTIFLYVCQSASILQPPNTVILIWNRNATWTLFLFVFSLLTLFLVKAIIAQSV
jgi:hypothetical protein